MSDTDIDCAVCGDSIDVITDSHFRLGEEKRPVPDREDMKTDDWYSRSWVLCWPCVFSKLGLVDEPEEHE